MKNKAKITNAKMANHLKRLRNDENFTMRALAEVIGTPHSFIGKMEQQGRRLDVGEFVYYCQAMRQDPIKVLQAIIAL
jgi:transcriptional regulator with XRE-family HTH domain